MVKSFLVCAAVVAIFAIGITAEIVDVSPCTRTAKERNPLSTVYSVDISPCAAAPSGPCEVRHGEDITIKMDFAPNITTPRRGTRQSFSWEQAAIDLPLSGVSNQACRFFNCRQAAFVRRNYTTSIPIKASMPPRTYPVKVKLYAGSKVISCFFVPISIVRAAGSS